MKQLSVIILVGFALLFFFIVSFENPIQASAEEQASITSLTSDFKIAPNTTLPEGSNFYNASIASDPDNGFLVTWINTYKIGATRYFHNYACRFSKTGEMLDSEAILLGESYWPYYCPSAVFAGGNWIICFNQGGLYEYVGVVRLTPSGEILDTEPVNICNSIGMATILYPIIAKNGQEILCVTGIAGKGLYGSIFDSDLNILVDRFPIFEQTVVGSFPRVCANGNNFFITFLDWQNETNIKLVIVNPQGQTLSTQDVSEDWGYPFKCRGIPTITTLNDISYITYFDKSAFWVRRYSSDGNPKDSSPVKIVESQEFDLFLEEYSGTLQKEAYTDLVWANESFRFFLPSTPLGISMMSFKPNLSTGNHQPVLLDSQCQLDLGSYMEEESYSLIRASSLGNKVLTVWIDEREGNGRVYGNLFEVTSNGGGDNGGNGDSAGKKSPCFIATAAYGSPLHPHLDVLRDLRDKYLIPTKVGRAFVNLYYKYSPFAADLIAKHKVLKFVVRISLLPLVAFSYSLLHFGPIITAVMSLFIFGLPVFLTLFFRRKMK